MSNATNYTCNDSLYLDVIGIVDSFLLFFLFLGLGLSCEPEEIRDALRKPKAIVIILLGQFGMMPLLAWLFGKAGNFPPELAVALVVCLSAPGGALSNILTTIFQGDVALSVGATGVSSLIAIGLMPLCQYVYIVSTQMLPVGSPFCLKVVGIVWSAAIVVVSILSGVLLRLYVRKHKMYRTINFVYSLSGIAGLGIVIIGFVSNSSSSTPFWQVKPIVFLCTISPLLIGSVTIWIISGLVKIPSPGRVSTVLEINIHNKNIAFAAIGFMLEREQASRALAIPIVYQFFALVYSTVFCIAAWKLGYTNLPKDKSFYEAFKIARVNHAEQNRKRIYGDDKEVTTVVVDSDPASSLEKQEGK